MSITDILFNAAGGGIFGSLLHLGTSVFETWRKKKDAEVEIMLLNAKVQAAEREAAWNAFAKSQENAGAMQIPASASPLIANVYLGVDAFRNFTRPGLTWALLLVLVYVFSVSPEAARQQMLGEITFGAFTALFWWFGSRYSRK
ncbi:MAG: hypothetical protein RIR91_1327 [Verrucomicrobiota bacterium]